MDRVAILLELVSVLRCVDLVFDDDAEPEGFIYYQQINVVLLAFHASVS